MVPLQQLEALLPSSLLEELAMTHQVDKHNQVRLSGKLVFLCLLHTLLYQQDLTQRLLEETYAQYTNQHADHSSFGKRLAVIPPAYFAALFTYLHAKLAPQASLGERSSLHLRFVDATTVTLSAKLLHWGLLVGTRCPDKARRHIKSVLELSDGLPQLLHVCSDKSENADSVALGKIMHQQACAGDLFVFDKGCHGRKRLLDLHQKHAFFLTPWSQQHVRVVSVLFEADAEALPKEAPLSGEAHFVVRRVEQVVFENSQATQTTRKTWAQMPLVLVHGLRFDKRSKQWKALVLMTNLPLSPDGLHAGAFSFLELAAVYARRWDIEVFFKFIKQHLSFSHLVSRCENGIRVMLYMSLIAALLMLWYQRQSGLDRGWRSIKSWLAFDLRHWLEQAFDEAFRPLLPPLRE